MSGFKELHHVLTGRWTDPSAGAEEELRAPAEPLDVILTPQIKTQAAVLPADVQLVSVSGEEPPELQEWSSGLDQNNAAPSNIEEERNELWDSQEGGHLQGQEEDIIKFTFFPEDDEEKPQYSQLHPGQMHKAANEEDFGGSEKSRSSDPDRDSEYEIEVLIEDLSEPEAEDHKNVMDMRVYQSSLSSVEIVKDEEPKMEMKSFTCSRCGKTFKKKSRLIIHMRLHTGEKPFSCSECGKKYTARDHLNHHMSVHTGNRLFTCTECGKRFIHRGSLSKHLKVHTGEKLFICSRCDKRFNCKTSLVRHMRIHTGEKPFGCPECGKRFNEKGNMIKHKKIHTRGKPFSCSVCNQRFSQLHRFKTHKCVDDQASAEPLEKQTGKEMARGAEREECRAPRQSRNKYPKKHSLPRTEGVAEDASEAETDDSEDWKEATEDEPVLNHVENDKLKITQVDWKSHCCTECGKRFYQKSHLTDHLRTHTGEKPFSCLECGGRFSRKGSLTKHMRIHRRGKKL